MNLLPAKLKSFRAGIVCSGKDQSEYSDQLVTNHISWTQINNMIVRKLLSPVRFS
ncbi:MAG: hypothetical protein ACJ705_07900 [Nitrososphaeraceae archaeon]